MCLVAVAASMSLTACSSGGGRSSASSSPSAGPVVGGTLRAGVERIKSLDPAAASPGSQSDLLAADLLFDGLTAQPAGATQAQPALAQSWTPSADLQTWRFALRPGATFTNGRAITATDVKYSLERVAKQGETSLPGIRLEVIAGYAELLAGSATELAGVKALDPATVEITLRTPFATLPELLASPVYGIVPKEAVEAPAPAFASAPVGSGPFAFAGAAGDVLKLVRAKGGRARLDAIELRQYDDLATAYAAFTGGGLDWSLVPTAKVDDAIARYGDKGFRPFQGEVFYAFNVLDPALGDGRFRQAILQAIDRSALARAVTGGVLPLDGVVPDGVAGHVEDPCGAVCRYDPAASKALLAQAFPDGAIPTVNLDYAQSVDDDAVAGAIEASLAAVGIPVQKRPKAAADYDALVAGGQQSLFRLGTIGLDGAADPYLVAPFRGGSRDNATGVANATFDALADQLRATADPAARERAAQQAEQYLMQQVVVVIPIGQLRTRSVLGPAVRDLDLSLSGTFDAEQVWLSA